MATRYCLKKDRCHAVDGSREVGGGASREGFQGWCVPAVGGFMVAVTVVRNGVQASNLAEYRIRCKIDRRKGGSTGGMSF